MAFDGASWNESDPSDATVAHQIDDYNKDLRLGVRTRLDKEHVWPSSQTASSQAGHHRYVTFQAQTATPSLVAASNQVGALFVSTAAGYPLIFERSAGGEVVLVTTEGKHPEPPIGTIVLYAGSSAPTGWLLCDGSAVSRTTYASLFAICDILYGSGNGSTTFNLPNLKGKVPVGLDATQTEFDTLGETGGANTHALIEAELASHQHFVTKMGNSSSAISAVNAFSSTYSVSGDESYTGKGATPPADGGLSSATGSGTAHNNLQPYLTLNYIIKY